MPVLNARVRLSLLAVHAVGVLTLARSLAYERWITVIAALLLMAGAYAAQRGRTWGIGVAFGVAASFPTAWAIGIAPAWFCLVGMIGSLPFALTSRAIARFDAAATAVGAALAVTVGTLCAVTFAESAPWLFAHFPALRPAWHASSGGALAALVVLAVAFAAALLVKRVAASSPAPALSVGIRVASSSSDYDRKHDQKNEHDSQSLEQDLHVDESQEDDLAQDHARR